MDTRDRTRSQNDEEQAANIRPANGNPQKTNSGSVDPVVMPCTSTTDVVYDEPVVLDSSDELEYSDDETSDDQVRDLTVTFKSEHTSEEIPTATLIVKRQDPVDKFLPFVGALLRSIHNVPLKLKLMEDISQILINAKTEEIQRCRPV